MTGPDDAEAYLRENHAESAELALWTRARVREAEPDFAERVYRGWRGIGYHHPEAGYVCAIYPRNDWVVLLFEHGAAMADPEGVLEGKGTQTRFVRVASQDDDTAALIDRLVQQAVAERLLSYRRASR
jgi:hypothetical protein